MKSQYLIFSMFLVLCLIACEDESISNSDGNESKIFSNEVSKNNLFNADNIEEGYWIGQSGQKLEAAKMIISNEIPYNPNLTYQVNKTCYITYMKDDKILETRLHDDVPPFEIDKVEEANHIRISFDKSKLDSFALTKS